MVIKVHRNFLSLNVPEGDTECEIFTVISIDYLLVYENDITCIYI